MNAAELERRRGNRAAAAALVRRPGFAVSTRGLRVTFGEEVALHGLDLDIPAGTITGVLGRNGAGKSTLLRVLAAYLRGTGGTVRVHGDDPWEHDALMPDICLVRDSGNLADEAKVSDELGLSACLRPRWDADLAERLLDRFELSRRGRVGSLSRGQKTALAIVIGLASQAPLTLFDEPHLGLDAPSRQLFYDELLADYMANPRTMLISSHLIDEVAPLLEHVVVLHRGHLVLQAPADDLRERGLQITGPADRIEAAAGGGRVLTVRQLGPTASATVLLGPDHDRTLDADRSLDIRPASLQDLFIALTAKEAGA